MAPSQLEAIEIRVTDQRRSLEIDWSDGVSSRYGAEALRRACRCAECVRAQLDGAFAPFAEVGIARIDAIGSYAVNLQFSDGHARGIYPWSYLRALREAVEPLSAESSLVGAEQPPQGGAARTDLEARS